jgi:hypothetical protein
MAAAVVQQSIDYDDDDNLCPLCVEEMDLSDMNFLPCPCGYRVSFYFFVVPRSSYPQNNNLF